MRLPLAITFLLLLRGVSHAAVVRFNVVMDDDTQVVVDNASGWSEAEVTSLVLAADRPRARIASTTLLM